MMPIGARVHAGFQRTDIDAGTYDRNWLAGTLKAAGVAAAEQEAE